MALRNTTPIAIRPSTVADTLDATGAPPGAMALLKNLIPDPSTRNLWQCRPAATLRAAFTVANPKYVSALYRVGDQLYGMVSSDTFPGHDEPFGFNLLNNQFIPMTGVTANNVPISPQPTGAWVPPQMALVGTKIMVTHPGFTVGIYNAFVGQIDITNPFTPAWTAANLDAGGRIQFVWPPSFVAQFNQRAYYAINPPDGTQPSVIFSDSLNPLMVTNANQALTFGDNERLTAMAGLPLTTMLGGVFQSLMVFKEASIHQITGDPTTNDLAINALPISIGTRSPDTVVPTPYGLAFAAIDGIRYINFEAGVSDPLGNQGNGKTMPFTFATVPSRMVAACNGSVLRISTQDGSTPGAPVVEYWFDLPRKVWSGPHSFPFSKLVFWRNTFIGSPWSGTPGIYQSDPVQTNASIYLERGALLTWEYRTSMLPDTDQMSENAMVESTVYMQIPSGQNPYPVTAYDQDGVPLGSANIVFTSPQPLWGQSTWGQFIWGGAVSRLGPRRVAWPVPIVFRRMQIVLTGQSAFDFKIGVLHCRYQQLRYLQMTA